LFWKEGDIISISKKLLRKFKKRVEYLLMIGSPAYKVEGVKAVTTEAAKAEVKLEEEEKKEEEPSASGDASQVEVSVASSQFALEESVLDDEDSKLLSRVNDPLEDEDETEDDDDESEEKKAAIAEYKHSLKDMNAKKRRIVDAIDKRINETLVIKKILV
jgi:hypothetical protein